MCWVSAACADAGRRIAATRRAKEQRSPARTCARNAPAVKFATRAYFISRFLGDQLPPAVHRDGHRDRGLDQASTLLSGYSMPTFLMSALKRGSERRGSKKGAGVTSTLLRPPPLRS